VSRATSLRVCFADGTALDAAVIAIDSEHDLAVLRVDADKPLPTVPLGRSDDIMVGETVIAIVNPLGYQHTVTSGVVSAVNRDIEISRDHVYGGLIQTDASINPGNSGGPLLNALGELIGVNTAIRGDAQNIGFAIPVDHLIELLPQMLNVERDGGFEIGLSLDGLDRAVVAQVAPGGPAADAGLQAGDVITALADQPVNRRIDFEFALVESLRNGAAGEEMPVAYSRDGVPAVTRLEIKARPKPEAERLARSLFGLELRPLSAAEMKRFDLRPGEGLMVEDVRAGSAAHGAQIRSGDVLFRLGRFSVRGFDQVERLLATVDRGDLVSISFLRDAGRHLLLLDARLRAGDGGAS
jgi:serine protease Do